MRLLILLLSLVFLPAVCRAQTKPIGEEPVVLDNFDFKTKITSLYPDKNKSKKFENYYEISVKSSIFGSDFVVKETTFENRFDEALKKADGIEYHQQNSSTENTLAIFGKQRFNKINLATTLDDKIKLVGVVAIEISKSESDGFIKLLTAKYGAYKKLKGNFAEKIFFIYEWKTKDRIFRYAPISDDQSNSLVLEIDQTNKTVKSRGKEPHLEGYFYIIKNEFINDIDKISSGDFVYLNKD